LFDQASRSDAAFAKGKPLALLWAFLESSSLYSSKLEHRDSLNEWGTHEARVQARREFAKQAGSSDYFAKERPLWPGEALNSEPLGIAG
jgi:hypothetical protein